MLLVDLIATPIITPPVVGSLALGSYAVGAGDAAADGAVGFTIGGLDISFIPGIGATASGIGDELADILNGTAEALHTSSRDGSGTLVLTAKAVGLGGNAVILDVTTDTGIAAGTPADCTGGVNAAPEDEIIEVTDGVTVVNIRRGILTTNSSLVRRLLAKAGIYHDLENGNTSQMLSHAIALRILEQL